MNKYLEGNAWINLMSNFNNIKEFIA